MEPQLYRCGNVHGGIHGGYGTGRFNGAATLSLRKCLERGHLDASHPVLQWSRNFIVAEIARTAEQLEVGKPSFNGAATLSLRKLLSMTAVPAFLSYASMEPQLYRCGNALRR